MRIIPVAMIGLALLAGCASKAPAPSAASGAPSTTSTAMQGDSIDRFAAAYEQQHPRR